METMEVMNNVELEEVIEVAEEIVPKSGNGMKVAGGAAALLAVGVCIYKGVKWAKAKKQAKKGEEEITAEEAASDEDCED